jgi:hypothetical protein
MSRQISFARGLAAACLAAAVMLAGAAPSVALPPNKVEVIEKVRPTGGRASEILVAGSLHDVKAIGLRSVEVTYIPEIDEETVIVTLDVIPAPGDHNFAYPIDLPPMRVGQPGLGIATRLVGETSSTIATGDYFYVHPRIEVDLESSPGESEGFYDLRIRSGGPWIYFHGFQPQVVGNTIKIRMSYNCLILCPSGPPEWVIDAGTIGPLAPGTYTVEMENYEAYLPEAVIAYRGQVEVPEVEPDDRILLRGGRFELQMELAAPHQEIPRLAMPATEDSALFYFFSPDNWEAMFKVLDGCALNGRYWVFGAASTDVGYTLRVKDLANPGVEREYRHEPGAPAPALTDIDAFSCD